MNKVYLSVQASSDPKEIYVDQTRTNVIIECLVPPASGKAPTPVTVHVYGKDDKARVLSTVKQNSTLFIAGGILRHDLKTREHTIHGGSIYAVSHETFGIVNEIILGGRCIREVDQSDARSFRCTDSGYMITNQTLSVNTGKQQADLFNLYAINKADDRYNQAQLLCDFTHKGTGLTICGRLVTDAWTDKASGEQKSSTKIQVNKMTLAPKSGVPGEVKPSNTINAGSTPTSLWGGQTMQNESPQQDAIAPAPSAPTPPAPVPALDPWVKANESMNELVQANAAQALPDLPASTDDDAPF